MADGREAAPRHAVSAAEAEARASDGRLLRRVRWRLAFWSGTATLLVLLTLGFAIYVTVRDSLLQDMSSSSPSIGCRCSVTRKSGTSGI